MGCGTPRRFVSKSTLDRLETVLLETQDRLQLADLPPLAFAAGILVVKCLGFEVPNLTESQLIWWLLFLVLRQVLQSIWLLALPR